MKDFEDSMDDFDFKPITKGLGFHHSLQEKSKIKSELKMQSESLKLDLDERAKKLLGNENSSLSTKKSVTHMGELSAFYAEPITVESIPRLRDIASTKTDYRYFDAPMGIRFKAWSIDIAIVTMMFTFTISSLFLFTDMPFDYLAKVMISSEIAPSMLAVFSLYYFLYFSTLDKTSHSTIGKHYCDIKVVAHNGELTLSQTISKSVLGLVSIFSMGILTILSLTDQFSKTRVIQK